MTQLLIVAELSMGYLLEASSTGTLCAGEPGGTGGRCE